MPILRYTKVEIEERRRLLAPDARREFRTTRYWMFRLQNEAAGGCTADGVPKELVDRYEATPGFAGWPEFAKSWDIDPLSPTTIILREKSVWDEHDEEILKSVPILPAMVEKKVKKKAKKKKSKGAK